MHPQPSIGTQPSCLPATLPALIALLHSLAFLTSLPGAHKLLMHAAGTHVRQPMLWSPAAHLRAASPAMPANSSPQQQAHATELLRSKSASST